MKEQTQFDGWLLDVSTYRDGVVLWAKTAKEKKIVKILNDFSPEFFAAPKESEKDDLKRLKNVLKSHPQVKSVRICEKYVRLEDPLKTKVFGVSVSKPAAFKATIREIDELGLFTLYNTDLPISQMYFYTRDLFPMSRCNFGVEIEKGEDGTVETVRLVSLELNDNNENLFYDLPPLKAAWLEVKVRQSGIKPYFNEPIAYVEISLVEDDAASGVPRADGKKKCTVRIENSDESKIFKEISRTIEKLDPDIILTDKGDEFVFPYLVARASFNRVSKDLYFSRDKTPLKNCLFNLSGDSDHYMSYGIIRWRSKTQVYFNGRLHLDTAAHGSLHFSEGNIPGVVEVARVSRVSVQRLSRITIGGALQSIQYYNAYKLDHLIPPFKKSPEDFSSGFDLIKSDRGGHIIEPLIGVFDQVIELDFSSMYPSLMANYNISSETLNCKCCKDDGTGVKVPGLPFHICSKREGIIAKSIRLPLNKRLTCKAHVKRTGDSRYKFVDIALKWVLVVSFGYLGFRNARFGKIEAHQTVCAFAREFLLRTAKIAEDHGCKIVHGIVDSIYLQDALGRSVEEFERVTKEVAREVEVQTKIPISWEGRYNFVVFLPSRAIREVPTLNHYWGIKSDGEKKVRGIEMRRRDIPIIVKKAQNAFIEVFKGVASVKEFMEKVPEAKKVLFSYVNKIETGSISKEDLSIYQHVSRKPSQYKVNSYQAVAAKQTERSGVVLSPGKSVRYIILNADADPAFPEKKVILSDLYDEKRHHYDKKKYLELLKRAFENLFPFQFPDLDDLLKMASLKHTNQKDLTSYLQKGVL